MLRAMFKSFLLVLEVSLLLVNLTETLRENGRWIEDRYDPNFHGDGNVSFFLNFGLKRRAMQREPREHLGSVDRIMKSKAEILSGLLKIHIDRLRNQTDQLELVFLVDASGSVGIENFRNELDFVRKLLSDFTVEPAATRVAVVTFGGKRNIRRNIDQISHAEKYDNKCYLLNKQLNNITYTGGGTYTRGALMEALTILEKGRADATKAVFLITDGFSNGGDPRPAANLLKSIGATVFTFGIRTGNIEELHDIASYPGYTHSYLLDSFAEFEALARRALHRDLKSGSYVPVTRPDNCDSLCTGNEAENKVDCCDKLAVCSCGVVTGHYSCICPTGYFGSGLIGFCHPCPNGTYASGDLSGDSTSVCVSCPDVNHVTIKVPATSVEDCVCASGFITDKNKCEVITCPRLKVPENGYLVKASACSNVVHAACGIRCRIGFHLTGDSIRLCGKDGTWSGNEPKCLLKTCPALRAPAHGRVRCHHEEDYQHRIKEDAAAYPIDTRCQFRCEPGFQLRGSKVRNCLPLSQWDGLKATCKAVKCEPLKKIANGKIEPEDCYGPGKVSFGTNCTISCKKGFVLEGPRMRVCGGRTGVWSQRHNGNRCIDKIPPSITCPEDVISISLPGENYAYVNWTLPKVTDNVDKSPVIWTKPHMTLPWKVKIGTRSVVYIAQDSNGNRARCKFRVKVLDKEPPMIENCIDPPVYFTDRDSLKNVTWDEPGFYDNSKTPVRVAQSHRSGESEFPLGVTRVVYNATDKYDNAASCVLNITVKDICESLPAPSRGNKKCAPNSDHPTECVLSCEEGFEFAVQPPNLQLTEDELLLKCNSTGLNLSDNYVPDCTESYVPKTVSQEGSVILEGNDTLVCDNQTTLRELSKYITDDLTSTLLDICGNDIECNLISFDPECDESFLSPNSVRKRREGFAENNFSLARSVLNHESLTDSIIRLKRTVRNASKNHVKPRRRKEKIEIKFKFVGRIIEENFENPREGVQKLRQKIESLSASGKLDLLNSRTNQEIAKLALNLHLVFKDPQELCDPGSVLKKHTCVKCPLGTFYDSKSKHCNACPFGQYQNATGSLLCIDCPEYTFTRKMHAKSLQDCISVCRPGHYSRRRRYQGPYVGLQPCLICDYGFYQPKYGQSQCLACPPNTATKYRGSTDVSECLPFYKSIFDVCQRTPCLNGGKCIQEEENFSCECPSFYIGSKCETFQNPCDSSPCLNEGTCNVQNITGMNDTKLYACTCKAGYTGSNCESYIDECSRNPCKNGAKCVSTEADYSCECKDGFEGEFCETVTNHCDSSPCEEGSTCVTMNGTWHCICKPGFVGLHCNLLPCDWLPCQGNSYCVNVEEENATRMSYKCECEEGYTGENCTEKINYCESSPCHNDGKCISGLRNYTCICGIPFTGCNCETELSTDYIMHFVKSGTTDYAIMKGPTENLLELTICLWLQSKDTFNYGTVLSYATRFYDNAFTLTDYNGFVLYINGQKVVTDIKANDGNWHFVCVTWESRNGSWAIFIDGYLRDNGTRLAKGTIIQGNGSLVVGQEQDRLGGGFSESESFLGKVTLLDIWDTVLPQVDVRRFLNTCTRYHGNVVAWPQMQDHIRGEVAILNTTFCRGCPLPFKPFKGYVNVSEDFSEVTYYCEAGYVVRFRGREYRSLKLRCLKQGEWEGYRPPVCMRRKCGFPGYFPRGRVHGRSYLFGDEIHYSCMSGYELRGNPRRVCNSEGKWSGLPPICIGKTCKNLLAPENGDIEYIIEEYERDDISILQAGQQLEFKCDPGFRLIGERYLTCLESGIWDSDRPTCVLYGCPPPKAVPNSYAVSTQPHVLNESFTLNFHSNETGDVYERHYYYNEIVRFSCKEGYRFHGHNSSVTELEVQCSENGIWIGNQTDCELLKCPWPEGLKNGKVILKAHSGKIIEEQTNVTFSNGTASEAEGDGIEIEEGSKMNLLVPGVQISILCDSGFQLIGEKSQTCTNDLEWSAASPRCEPFVCSLRNHPVFQFLENIENGAISEEFSNLSIENDKINSVKNFSSSYGNVKYFVEGNNYKERITLTCKHNRSISLRDFNVSETLTSLTWSCNENGKWEILNLPLNNTVLEYVLNNAGDSMCQELTCDPPRVPEYGYILNDSNVGGYLRNNNSAVVFKCRNGYSLVGNEVSICLSDGSWSAIPFCKPVKCSKPPAFANAILKEDLKADNFTFGNMANYQCKPGYVLFGQASARCLANGKWSRISGKCSKLSCNKPKLPPGVTVHGRSYLYQDQLSYVCPGGKKQGLITCKADGKWSEPPSCNDN